jgi:hypothetical protein
MPGRLPHSHGGPKNGARPTGESGGVRNDPNISALHCGIHRTGARSPSLSKRLTFQPYQGFLGKHPENSSSIKRHLTDRAVWSVPLGPDVLPG